MYVDKPESEIFCQISQMSAINGLFSARYLHCSFFVPWLVTIALIASCDTDISSRIM